MVAIVLGLLLSVVVALGIVILVALPNLRQGSRILTPGAQRAVKRVRPRVKRKPAAQPMTQDQPQPMAQPAPQPQLAPQPQPVGQAQFGPRPDLMAEAKDAVQAKQKAATLARHQAVARAGRAALLQVREKSVAAAGGIGNGLLALQRLLTRWTRPIARGWAPVSVALHGLMDQLEARDAAKVESSGPADPAAHPQPSQQVSSSPGVPASPEGPASPRGVSSEVPQADLGALAPTVRQERFDVAKIIGGSSVGRPRSVPMDSGPIPEIRHDRKRRSASVGRTHPADRTIDLREPQRSNAE